MAQSNAPGDAGGEKHANQPENNEEKEFTFDSVYTDNFPKILKGLRISLAVTSYQAQRLFFIRSTGDGIDTNFKFFPRPRGVYADRERLTLGTLTQVLEFRRNDTILRRIQQGELDDPERMTKKVLEKDAEKMRELREKRERELAAVKKETDKASKLATYSKKLDFRLQRSLPTLKVDCGAAL